VGANGGESSRWGDSRGISIDRPVGRARGDRGRVAGARGRAGAGEGCGGGVGKRVVVTLVGSREGRRGRARGCAGDSMVN